MIECSDHHRRDFHATTHTECYRLILGLLTFGMLARGGPDGQPGPGGQWPRALLCGTGVGPEASCPTIANCPRFLVLTNWNSEAVLDKETGLVWERSPALTTHTWSDGAVRMHGPHDRQPQRLAAAVHPRAGEPDLSLRGPPRPDPPAGPSVY